MTNQELADLLTPVVEEWLKTKLRPDLARMERLLLEETECVQIHTKSIALLQTDFGKLREDLAELEDRFEIHRTTVHETERNMIVTATRWAKKAAERARPPAPPEMARSRQWFRARPDEIPRIEAIAHVLSVQDDTDPLLAAMFTPQPPKQKKGMSDEQVRKALLSIGRRAGRPKRGRS